MFKAIWAARWFVLLGLFVFTLTLAITTPLHFVWRYAEPYTNGLPIQIQRISGTLWHGKVQVVAPVAGVLDIDWQLDPWNLLAAQANLELDVSGDGISVETQASLTKDLELQLVNTAGFLSSKHLAPMLQQGRASLQGDFEVSDLNTRLDLANKQVLDLSGQLTFTGGDVGFPVDGNPIQATLPLLIGTLHREDDKSVLDINTQEGLPIGQAFMQHDGWGGVAIRRRFLDILGQQWPAKATEETVIFEVSQKIL